MAIDHGHGASSEVSACLFGAPFDTGNHGVTALGIATVAALHRRAPAVDVTVFDNGSGTRCAELELPDTRLPVALQGAWHSRRYHRPESLRRMQFSSVFQGRTNPGVAAIARAAVAFDLSGGDSFTDLYGTHRFELVTILKRLALKRGTPLVLLPQTYGPFASTRHLDTARRIVLEAAQAWARDEDSFERLTALLGPDLDPERHRTGVDVAFALPAREPERARLRGLTTWLAREEETVGVNVSGLLKIDQSSARSRFKLRADYVAALHELVERLLAQPSMQVLLVPHVLGDWPESDVRACAALLSRFKGHPRIAMLPGGLDALETKWVISRLRWFTAARMHATIAALSSGVPVAGVAYSDKIRGVFASCSAADEVVDARALDTAAFSAALWASFERRADTRSALMRSVPLTVARAEVQFDLIVTRALGQALTVVED